MCWGKSKFGSEIRAYSLYLNIELRLPQLHIANKLKRVFGLRLHSSAIGDFKAETAEKYEVTFPLFAKLHVKGAEQHPLYGALTGNDSPFPGEIKWNFGKFLVGKDGKILKRFEPQTKPDAPEVVEAIEAALAAK